MTKMCKLRGKLLLAPLVGLGMLAVDSLLPTSLGLFVSEAHAVLGRPLTPGSVAGVARRTTRRVIRRSSIYVATLPAGCERQRRGGVELRRSLLSTLWRALRRGLHRVNPTRVVHVDECCSATIGCRASSVNFMLVAQNSCALLGDKH